MLRIVLIAVVTAGAAMFFSGRFGLAVAQGAQIEEAKAAGVIGERIDGYIGVVRNAPIDVSLQRRINEINARRRAAYDELANGANATPAQVARITGEKQLARAPAGQYVLDESGNWVRKAS